MSIFKQNYSPVLRFFRRFRQNLFNSSKFGSYLLYAVGEIILVVIGILIALQINTWNDQRKKSLKESEILESIFNSLDSDTTYFNGIRGRLEISNEAIDILKDLPEYHDSLIPYFSRARMYIIFNTNNSAFGQLQSIGADIIANDSLRKAVFYHYDFIYQRNGYYIKSIQESLMEGEYKDYYDEHFIKTSNDPEFRRFNWEPLDYNQIRNDPKFLSILIQKRQMNNGVTNSMDWALRESEQLMEEIRNYLDSKVE